MQGQHKCKVHQLKSTSFRHFSWIPFPITPPTSAINSRYTCERTRNRSSQVTYFTILLIPLQSQSKWITTAFLHNDFLLSDQNNNHWRRQKSYSCSSRLAFIKVPAYGQIGRNSIINFPHSLTRFQTRSSLEHTVDCAQLMPAWERTRVLNTEAKEASKIITKTVSYTTLYE